jgi:hypothetical protein
MAETQSREGESLLTPTGELETGIDLPGKSI